MNLVCFTQVISHRFLSVSTHKNLSLQLGSKKRPEHISKNSWRSKEAHQLWKISLNFQRISYSKVMIISKSFWKRFLPSTNRKKCSPFCLSMLINIQSTSWIFSWELNYKTKSHLNCLLQNRHFNSLESRTRLSLLHFGTNRISSHLVKFCSNSMMKFPRPKARIRWLSFMPCHVNWSFCLMHLKSASKAIVISQKYCLTLTYLVISGKLLDLWLTLCLRCSKNSWVRILRMMGKRKIWRRRNKRN